jgi:hypothetical protein
VTQALWTIGGAGTVAILFVLGVLWERKRHPPPPSVYEVHLTVEDPPDPSKP